MKTSETWALVESKMLELRLITDANWNNSEFELAVLGEKVLRTVENSKVESEILRSSAQQLEESMDALKQQAQYNRIFKESAK
jgi:hypothetical protein